MRLMGTVSSPHCTDGTMQDSNLERLLQILERVMTATGRDLKVARDYKQWSIEAGFIDVEEVAPSPGKFNI